MLKKLSVIILCSSALLVNASVLAKPMATEIPGIANGTNATWTDTGAICAGITLPKVIKPNTDFKANQISVDATQWDKADCAAIYKSQGMSALILIQSDPSAIGWRVIGAGSAEALGQTHVYIDN